MAKLVLSSGGSVVHQYFIDKERLTIGREAHNDVVIEDPAVSRDHAVIITVGNDRIVEDLDSGNGTFINGTRVSRQILQHGDVMRFGHYHLRYVNPKGSTEINLEQTMLIASLPKELRELRGGVSAPEETAGPVARTGKVHFPSGRVKIIGGPGAGVSVELDRVVATFGTPGEQLAVITRRPHGYFLSHVEGRHYPRVNKQPIGAEPHALRSHDVIEVADVRLEFLQD
ncbi:MAG: FHA domain-containing protein [Pseudomonadota bacterium]|jgi:pSer/pThr/pTyr-binding forkhead associated (FHA) protein